MPFIAPQCDRTPSFPLAKRWSGGGMSYTGTPRGDIDSYRSHIDHMQSHQFLWMPYRDLLDHLPEAAFRDSGIWTANTALICFQNVEWHQTNKVKLQFGLLQEIPNEPANMDAQHSVDMRGNQYENWKDVHAEWIQLWMERRRRVLTRQPILGRVLPTNEYMVWLRSNSNLYLSIQSQLRDPRGGLQEESDFGPSMPPTNPTTCST